MRNDLIHAHVKIIGDTTRAPRWLPFAKSKLRDLLDHAARTSMRTLVRRFRPEGDVEVTVRLVEGEKFILIEVFLPCRDRQGFILNRVPGGQEPIFDAYYNDGIVERINPTEGTPRPDPDPAERTKFYKVTPQLLSTGPGRLVASKFSGLMRLVVGCYHAAGREAPFSYDYATTHGIVQKEVLVDNEPVQRYWIAEISSLGVYAAPITNTGKCCDSWGVTRYMPTLEEVEATPSFAVHRTLLSLWWAYTHGNRPGVVQLVSPDNMEIAYGLGTPWFDEHGWAFSASGGEAQHCVRRAAGSPEDHWLCSRMKITFSLTSEQALNAALSILEQDQVATFTHQDVIWVPDNNIWVAASDFSGTPEIETYSNQDVPVQVFYDGETEMISRFSLGHETVPAFTTPSTDSEGASGQVIGTVAWNNTRIAGTDSQQDVPNCGVDVVNLVTDAAILPPGENIVEHDKTTAGFTAPGFSGISPRYSLTKEKFETVLITRFDFPSASNPNNNSYTLRPECYYIDPVTGNLVTVCAYQFDQTFDIWDVYNRITDESESAGGNSALVLFPFEREAVLLAERNSLETSGTGTFNVPSGGRFLGPGQVEEKADTSLCPFITRVGRGTLNFGSVTGAPAYNGPPSASNITPFSAVTASARAVMLMPGLFAEALIALGPPPFFTAVNFNLGTFLVYDPVGINVKVTAESNVFAMHGNMVEADARLTPPDQTDNRVYLLDEQLVVDGGFQLPQNEVVAFVGRA